MKCVFVSNYLTLHQVPFCEELYRSLKDDFYFVSSEPMSESRKNLNWEIPKAPYELRPHEYEQERALAEEFIASADVAIISGNANSYLGIKKRLKQGKLTFRFSERLYKSARTGVKDVLRGIKHFSKNAGYKNLYLIGSSAYAAADYASFGLFKDKAYVWGYFPPFEPIDDIDLLISQKEENSIAWVARLIPLKHPELPIMIAERLKEEGYSFKIKMIGPGTMEEELSFSIKEKKLENYVELLGVKTPEECREYMEKSQIFLFTSDRREGWGAVVNEAMSSGCAVVSSHAVGSAPQMIEDGKNGYLYKDGSIDDAYLKVKKLLDDVQHCRTICKNAYKTMETEWNGKNAAQKFLTLCEGLLKNPKEDEPFKTGVLRKASILKNNWY